MYSEGDEVKENKFELLRAEQAYYVLNKKKLKIFSPSASTYLLYYNLIHTCAIERQKDFCMNHNYSLCCQNYYNSVPEF